MDTHTLIREAQQHRAQLQSQLAAVDTFLTSLNGAVAKVAPPNTVALAPVTVKKKAHGAPNYRQAYRNVVDAVRLTLDEAPDKRFRAREMVQQVRRLLRPQQHVTSSSVGHALTELHKEGAATLHGSRRDAKGRMLGGRGCVWQKAPQ